MLSSCYETKQEFTLNPDGSGKVLHEYSFQNVNLANNENKTPEEALQAAIARIINDSKGVDAWNDVSFKQLWSKAAYPQNGSIVVDQTFDTPFRFENLSLFGKPLATE